MPFVRLVNYYHFLHNFAQQQQVLTTYRMPHTHTLMSLLLIPRNDIIIVDVHVDSCETVTFCTNCAFACIRDAIYVFIFRRTAKAINPSINTHFFHLWPVRVGDYRQQ